MPFSHPSSRHSAMAFAARAAGPALAVLVALLVPARAGVLINEFVSSNGSTIADEDGSFEDWIELHNPGATEADLTDWGLSDNASNPFKWTFPAGTTIPAGGHLLVWASGKQRQPGDELPGVVREVWTGISGTTVASLTNHPSFPDHPASINRLTDFLEAPTDIADHYGQRLRGVLIPPQTGNYVFWIASDDDSALRLATDDNPANAVVIASVSTWTSPRQWDKFPSQQSAPIPLVAGQLYYFEALMKEGTGGDHLALRWQLPDGTIEEPIPAHHFISSSPAGELHTGFRISSAGEPLTLTRPDGTTADQVPPVFVPRDVSYGRLTDGAPTWHYFVDPTPGAPNNSTPFTLPPTVSVSQPRGFRSQPFSVTLSTPDAAATIRYTLDGSTPGPSSPVYTSPLHITGTTTLRASAIGPGMIPLPPTTATWIFLDDVLAQGPNPPPGWPADREINNHRMEYGMRAEIVANDNTRLRQGMLSIPSISLVTDLGNLFDANDGIYSYSNVSHGQERPVSVELIDPDGNPDAEFQIDAGLRLRGAFSRTVNNPKHSLRLLFRSAYGENQLNFPLFGEEGASSFDKVDLRTEQNYSWAFENDSRNTFIREVFSRDTQRDMGIPYTRSRYYHLYINGRYWGLYMTQERGESDWAATYLGGDSDDWDTIKTSQPGYVTEASDGNFEAFYALHNIAVNEGFSGPHADNYWRVLGLDPDGSRNPSLPVYVDQDNLIKYMLITHYVGDRDAPVSLFITPNRPNNLYGLFNRNNPDGFKWLRHDAEHTLGVRSDEGVTWDPTFIGQNITAQNFFNPATLNWHMLDHPEYRMRFADLAQRHFFQDGALTPDNARARVLSRMAEIDTAIIGESARWGRGHTRDGHWWPATQAILSYLEQRRDVIIGHYRNRGWFPSIDAPSVAVDGSLIKVFFNTPLYYMTDGRDPRLPGGGIHPDAVFVDSVGEESEPVELVPREATWRYYDAGAEPPVIDGRAWTDPDYPDNAWSAGPAILGFVGADPQNPVATPTRRWVTGTSGPQVITTYFRHEFILDEAADFSGLLLEILRDDGAVVYLNGTEILRENMPAGPVTYDTLASSVVGWEAQTTWFIRTPDVAGLLHPGTNVLAVSIHQNWPDSTDKYFGLSLTAMPASQSLAFPLHSAHNLRIRGLQDGEWSALNDVSTLAGLPDPVAIHSWNFDNAATFLLPTITSGNASLTNTPGPDTAFVHNGPAASDGLPTGHLRVNNPPGASLTFHLPTTGFDGITVSYDTRRSNQGATQQVVSYSLDGVNYTTLATETIPAEVRRFSFDFSAIPGVADNPAFRFRITIEQGDGGTAGNNRFDNFTISGFPMPGVNLPPVLDESALPSGPLVAGSPVAANLGAIFTDPEGDSLSYSADSSNPSIASASIFDGILTITPLAPGETTLTLSADDGENAPATATVTFLVYPAPHQLSAGPFRFEEWEAAAPAMSYPANMIFLQSERDDPTLHTLLDRAYQIPPADAAAAVDVDFPYNATSRTRINGLGSNGIAFINTGRGRDVGAALVALDTSDISNATVTFDAGTVLANTRIYAIRLQYRVGTEGDFNDVTDAGGNPVEYLRAATGNRVTIGPVPLPQDALDEPLVQLLWRYHHVSGTSGARAQLLLDDILVTAPAAGDATALVIDTSQPAWVQDGIALAPITVRAVNEDGLTDTNFNGPVTLELSGDGTLGGTLTVNALNGIAVFENLTVSGTSGEFILRATGGDLATGESSAFLLTGIPVFLPGGDADWTIAANWTGPSYPDAPGAAARVRPSAAGNRNINLQAPVVIGDLDIEQADSTARQRLRDRSTGNTLTFDGDQVHASLHVSGTGTGFVELENVAGTILGTDLELSVHNIAGDPEHGALRLRETWTGPGGLIKTGPGMASLTGEGKDFTGQIVIDHGVLQVTEPATPASATGITVTPGGQLRLNSASSETSPVRTYSFGAPIHLAGQGRSGVPDGEGLGVLGALRYEPGSMDNAAMITSAVVLDSAATVHVAGNNLLTLSGLVTGDATLTKTGGGTLALAATNTPVAPPIHVQNGTLHISAHHPATVTLSAGTVLAGTGTIGAITGPGSVQTDSAQLTAHSSSAAHIAAVLADSGGVLVLTDAINPLPVAPGTIDLFLEPATPLRPGDRFAGGLSVPAHINLAAALDNTTVNLHVADPEGTIQHLGRTFRPAIPADQLVWAVTTLGTSQTLEVLRTGAPSSFDEWRNLHFPDADDRADDNISGPTGGASADASNLLRYALGIDATEPAAPALPRLDAATGTFGTFRFALDPAKSDLAWIVQASPDLDDWSEILFDSRIHVAPAPGEDGLTPIIYPPDRTHLFLRLRLLLNPEP